MASSEIPLASWNGKLMPLDQVTREVIDGIDRGDPLIIPGRIMRISWLAQRIAPGLLRRFLRHQVARVYQGPAAAKARWTSRHFSRAWGTTCPAR